MAPGALAPEGDGDDRPRFRANGQTSPHEKQRGAPYPRPRPLRRGLHSRARAGRSRAGRVYRLRRFARAPLAHTLADRVGILHKGELLVLEEATALKAKYGVDTLEAAFFAATGEAIEEGDPEEVLD